MKVMEESPREMELYPFGPQMLSGIPHAIPYGCPSMRMQVICEWSAGTALDEAGVCVLGSTKIDGEVEPGSDQCVMMASHFTMLNFHAKPIIYVVIDAEKHAAEPRRLKPNLAVDASREESIALEDLQQGLGRMFGTHTILTGFGLAGTLEALNLAAPLIQAVDFATNSAFYNLLEQYARAKKKLFTLKRDPCLSLSEVVYLLSDEQVELHKFKGEDRRCELIDTIWAARIIAWSLAPVIKAMSRVPWLLPVRAQSWLGLGTSLESISPLTDEGKFVEGVGTQVDREGNPFPHQIAGEVNLGEFLKGAWSVTSGVKEGSDVLVEAEILSDWLGPTLEQIERARRQFQNPDIQFDIGEMARACEPRIAVQEYHIAAAVDSAPRVRTRVAYSEDLPIAKRHLKFLPGETLAVEVDVRGQPDEVMEVDASGNAVVQVRQIEVVAERETGPAHKPIILSKSRPAREFVVPGVPQRLRRVAPEMDFLTKKRDKAELLSERQAILKQMAGTLHSYDPPRLLEIDQALIERHGFEWSRAGDGRRRAGPEGMGMSLDEADATAAAAAAPPVIRPDYVSRPTNYNRLPPRAPRTWASTSSTVSTSTALPPIGTIFTPMTGASASTSSSTAPPRQTSSSHAAPATPTVPVRSSTMMKTPGLLASAGAQPTTARVVHGPQSPVSMAPVSPAETLGTLRATASTTAATATTAAAPTGASARPPPPPVPPRK